MARFFLTSSRPTESGAAFMIATVSRLSVSTFTMRPDSHFLGFATGAWLSKKIFREHEGRRSIAPVILPNVSCGLQADSPAMSQVRPLCPQQSRPSSFDVRLWLGADIQRESAERPLLTHCGHFGSIPYLLCAHPPFRAILCPGSRGGRDRWTAK